MAKTKKSKKGDTLGPTSKPERPAYNAAIELAAVRKIELKEALEEVYGIRSRED